MEQSHDRRTGSFQDGQQHQHYQQQTADVAEHIAPLECSLMQSDANKQHSIQYADVSHKHQSFVPSMGIITPAEGADEQDKSTKPLHEEEPMAVHAASENAAHAQPVGTVLYKVLTVCVQHACTCHCLT